MYWLSGTPVCKYTSVVYSKLTQSLFLVNDNASVYLVDRHTLKPNFKNHADQRDEQVPIICLFCCLNKVWLKTTHAVCSKHSPGYHYGDLPRYGRKWWCILGPEKRFGVCRSRPRPSRSSRQGWRDCGIRIPTLLGSSEQSRGLQCEQAEAKCARDVSGSNADKVSRMLCCRCSMFIMVLFVTCNCVLYLAISTSCSFT